MLLNRVVVTFSLLWSLSQACNPNQSCGIDLDDEIIQNLLASMNSFTTQLIHKLYDPNMQFNTTPNVMSPWSAYVILVLMLFGSADSTQKELIQALHFPDGDPQRFRKSFGDILIATDAKRSVMVDGKENVIAAGHVAEGIFIQKDFTLVKEYADYLNALNIITYPSDFVQNMQATLDTILRWVKDNQPKSKSGASSFSFSTDTRISLTSLFYLTAKWKDNLFLDRSPGLVPFNTLNNGKVDVQMMKASTSLLYYDNKSSFTSVLIPFQDYDFAAVVILPNKGVDPIQFLGSFKMDVLYEFFSKAELKDIDCQIPTFSYTYSFGINQLLGDLGIKELFGEADLSNMLTVGKQNFGVQISHEIQIMVNEKGANADGLNVVPVKKNPPSANLIPFIAERPFLMLIRSNRSTAIVFALFFYG